MSDTAWASEFRKVTKRRLMPRQRGALRQKGFHGSIEVLKLGHDDRTRGMLFGALGSNKRYRAAPTNEGDGAGDGPSGRSHLAPASLGVKTPDLVEVRDGEHRVKPVVALKELHMMTVAIPGP